MEKDPNTNAQQAIRQERRLAEMKKAISDWRSSGLSAQEFGDSVGIPKTTLRFWSQEVRRKERDSATSIGAGSTELPSVKKARPTFLPLVATAEPSEVNVQGSLCIELFLQGGRRVAVSGLKLNQIAPLLVALEGVRGC